MGSEPRAEGEETEFEKPGFSVTHSSGKDGSRAGLISTSRGEVETPCFLPIASHGTLRALSFDEAAACGTRAVMANALYVFGKTGPALLEQTRGVHGWMNWGGVLMTDSGGYQVFSLRATAALDNQGVRFGPDQEALTPESSVRMQKHLGSDIMIVLDDCAPFPCSHDRAEQAARRTTLWAKRSMSIHRAVPCRYQQRQQLWGIIQGSDRPQLRKRCVEEVAALDFDGYGVGGLSIGMSRAAIRDMTALTCELLPPDRPRHLLGVGLPGQILEGIEDGVDTFDCVLPTRKAQRGIAYTRFGEVRYKHTQRKGEADLPLDSECSCSTCHAYSRAQLRQLYRSDKPEAGRLAAIHNLSFYHQVLAGARAAIRQDRFQSYKRDFYLRWPRELGQ